jgi:O-Antigen ligase
MPVRDPRASAQDDNRGSAVADSASRPVGSHPSRPARPSEELPPSTSHSTLRAQTDRSVREPGSEVAGEARRRWGRAVWFGIATYFAWSPFKPINDLLPAGSAVRGAILTLIPLIGVVAVLRLPTPERRARVDLLVVLLAALVIWQAVSVERTAGTSYLTHVIPGAALLLLAVATRGPVSEMSLTDIRFAVSGVLPPLCGFLLLGWIAQYAHLVASTALDSTIGFSVNGLRLQGLTTQPNNFGFLAALVTVIAFVAQAGKLCWLTRAVGALTVFASDSRTSIIVLGVGLFMLWVLGPGRDLMKRMAALLFLGAAGVAAWGIIDVQRQANTDVLSDRNVIWHDLIPYLHHLPIFGFGPNIFVQLDPVVFGQYTPYGQILDAQNQWLSDSIEFGFGAAVILTLCLVVIPIYGTQTYRWGLLLPLVVMTLIEGFSEVPLSIFLSIDGAFPLFLLVMWAPLRGSKSPVPRLGSPPEERTEKVNRYSWMGPMSGRD